MLKTTTLLSILAAGMIALPALADEQPSTLMVSGSGEVTAVPDMASFSVSVTNEGATAKEAMAKNTEQMSGVMAQLQAAGVAERDIQTSSINVRPRWAGNHGDSERPPMIVGYVASNSLNVRIEEISTLGGILDAVLSDGANSLGGIRFGLKDPRPSLNEARKLSVADAREQAELFAEAAGVRLVRIISISPMSHRAPMMMEMASFKAMPGDGVPVSEGEITTSADVSITWEIAPAD